MSYRCWPDLATIDRQGREISFRGANVTILIMDTVEARLKQQAQALGFALAGIAPATASDGFARLREWLERGYAGEMEYLHRHGDARLHPRSILPEVRSVVMVAMTYGHPEEHELRANHGRVARYARGPDYHDELRQRLKKLLAWIIQEQPGRRGRVVVDTAPLLERDFARRCGLGWFGKNTMLINRRQGSYLLLGGLLLDLQLHPDPEHATSHCGTCTACLDACPTGALVAPGWLDARRCISYLTIELRSMVPEPLRPELASWVFGCDICQEVCPWNRKAPAASTPGFGDRADLEQLDLIDMLALDEEAFRSRFRGTALLRAGRTGLLRSCALVLGSQGDANALPALQRAEQDADPQVREAAAWASATLKSRLDRQAD